MELSLGARRTLFLDALVLVFATFSPYLSASSLNATSHLSSRIHHLVPIHNGESPNVGVTGKEGDCH